MNTTPTKQKTSGSASVASEGANTRSDRHIGQERVDRIKATLRYIEHQAIEIVGNDGKTHQIWARSAMDAYRDATKWSYRHGGLDSVCLMILRDENEGCWNRAKRVPIGRQCDLATILEMNKEQSLIG